MDYSLVVQRRRSSPFERATYVSHSHSLFDTSVTRCVHHRSRVSCFSARSELPVCARSWNEQAADNHLTKSYLRFLTQALRARCSLKWHRDQTPCILISTTEQSYACSINGSPRIRSYSERITMRLLLIS